MLASLNLNKTIPVGNSDAGSYFNTKVLEAVDYGVRFNIPQLACSIKFILPDNRCPMSMLGSPILPPKQLLGGLPNSFRKPMCNQLLCCPTRFVTIRGLHMISDLIRIIQPKMYIAETGWPTVSLRYFVPARVGFDVAYYYRRPKMPEMPTTARQMHLLLTSKFSLIHSSVKPILLEFLISFLRFVNELFVIT